MVNLGLTRLLGWPDTTRCIHSWQGLWTSGSHTHRSRRRGESKQEGSSSFLRRVKASR